MPRAIAFVIGLLALPLLLPVILILEAWAGGFRPATILLARLLGLKSRPWGGLLPREAVVGIGRVDDDCYWLATPAAVAPVVPWASGFHVVPAAYFFAHNDATDPAIARVLRVVGAAGAAHPGCVIFLATMRRDADDAAPPDAPRGRLLRCPPQLGEPGGGAGQGVR